MSRGRGKAPDASHTVSAKSLERWEMVTTVLGFVGSRGGGFQMHELARRIGGRREIDFAQLSLVELEVLRQALAPFAVLAEIVDRWVEQAQDDLAGAFTDASPAPSGDPPRP